MKTTYPSFQVLCVFVLLNLQTRSQIINENFNAGMPAGWTQSPTATWTLSQNLGTSGSGCIFTEDVGSSTLTASLYTPTVNLNAVSNLTISFKASLVANNFVGPNVSVSFDNGTGPQFLARWGSGFTANTTYTLMYTSDYTPPLDAQNMSLTPCSHTVAGVTGNIGKFIFDAEFVNGGYVVIEDILITGVTTVTTGIEGNVQNKTILIFPNPTHTKKIKLEGAEIKNVRVYDNLGKAMTVEFRKINDTNLEVDLDNLPNGIYHLMAVCEDNVLLHKKIILE